VPAKCTCEADPNCPRKPLRQSLHAPALSGTEGVTVKPAMGGSAAMRATPAASSGVKV